MWLSTLVNSYYTASTTTNLTEEVVLAFIPKET